MAKIAIIYQKGQFGYVMSTFIKVLKEIKGIFQKITTDCQILNFRFCRISDFYS